MKTIADRIIKFRWGIIVIFAAIAFGLGRQIPKAKLNPDMMTYLPEDMPSRISKKNIEALFGGTEMLMVLVKTDDVLKTETLERVRKISQQMQRIQGVDRVLSLFELKNLKAESGAMIVEPAVKYIPAGQKEREQLRQEIKDNDLVYKNVVSEDFTVTAVIALVAPNISDEFLVNAVERLISQNPGEEEVLIGGTPFSRLNTAQNTKKDLGKLLPIGLVIMIIFLYFCFRQLRGVLLPSLVVVMSIMVAMGLIPLFGWEITAITIILPVILIAVANDYSIHIIARYQEDNLPGNNYSNKEFAQRMIRYLTKPILLTGLTTIAGMLCLQGHILIPAGQLGILAAIGIGFALLASLLLVPAIISFLPKGKPVINTRDSNSRRSILDRLLAFFAQFVSRKPRAVIAGAVIFTLIAAIGLFFIVVNTDPINYYPEEHPVARSANLINKHFGGFFPISVVFEGDVTDPQMMKKIDRLEKNISQIPEIGNTMSIARVLRQMSRVLNDADDEWYDKIPDTRDGIAQYFELYLMSGDPEDLEKMVDFPFEHAMINARINTSSTPVLKQVTRQIQAMIKGEPEVKYVGGIAEVFSDISIYIVGGQFISMAMATVVVAVLLMLFFRSIIAGFFSVIPLVLSMVIVFGLMGLSGIELNMATALLSSIMIGVGVDYTIHFLWRYREERRNGLLPTEAVSKTITTTGRGIVYNAFSVIIGFFVLLISSFIPVRFFGFLVVVSIFACLIGGLVLIPALCIVIKPKFLEPGELR